MYFRRKKAASGVEKPQVSGYLHVDRSGIILVESIV